MRLPRNSVLQRDNFVTYCDTLVYGRMTILSHTVSHTLAQESVTILSHTVTLVQDRVTILSRTLTLWCKMEWQFCHIL